LPHENGGSLHTLRFPREQDCGTVQLLRWFALQVRCRSEVVTSQLLKEKGYSIFVPLYRRRTPRGRRIEVRESPLFGGYVFCQFAPLMRLPILTTPGVIRILGLGRVPVPVEESEMNSLQTITQAAVDLRPCDYLRVGSRLRVESGPLRGVEGILLKKQNEQRLVVSITLLQRSVAVEFRCEDLSALDS
jgi:transcription termination/antitermination protein NusG